MIFISSRENPPSVTEPFPSSITIPEFITFRKSASESAISFIAFLISIYSTIDGSAVKNGNAIPYVMSMFALVPFVISPFGSH